MGEVKEEAGADASANLQKESLKIPDFERRDLQQKVSRLRESIPMGAKILDVGAGDGALGILAAVDRNGSLVQSDYIDRRSYKAGDLYKFKMASPGMDAPDFSGINANVALLADVVHHIGYGNGWDSVNKVPNPVGKTNDVMKFINGVMTGLTPEGKVLVLNTREEANDVISDLKARVDMDSKLKEKILIV